MMANSNALKSSAMYIGYMVRVSKVSTSISLNALYMR